MWDDNNELPLLKPKKRKPRLKAKREKLWKKDPRCFYCKCQLSLEESTLDHVIARSKGGSNKYENLVLCCRSCNNKKGDMSLKEFMSKNG